MNKERIQKLLLEFSEKIKKYRFDQRMSIKELATLTGVSVPTIYNFEENRFENTSVKTIMMVSDKLGLEISIKIKELKKLKPKQYAE